MKRVLALILLLGLAGLAWADCARGRVLHTRAAVVQAQAVVAAVPVAVPVYSQSFYDPNAAALAELRKEIAALRDAIEGKQAKPAPRPEAGEVEVKAAAILKANCASCHTAGSEKGGLALFDAAGALSADLPRGKVYYQAHRGLMPKGKAPLTDGEVETLLDWLGK